MDRAGDRAQARRARNLAVQLGAFSRPLHEVFAAAHDRLGLSQRQIAALLELSQPMVSYLGQARRGLPDGRQLELLRELAELVAAEDLAAARAEVERRLRKATLAGRLPPPGPAGTPDGPRGSGAGTTTAKAAAPARPVVAGGADTGFARQLHRLLTAACPPAQLPEAARRLDPVAPTLARLLDAAGSRTVEDFAADTEPWLGGLLG